MKTKRFLSLLIVGAIIFSALCSCSGNSDAAQHKDYASEVKLDMSSNTLKHEVTVKIYIDGDTTHFYFPGNEFEDGVIKARYLAINTPESTGKIEEWGKKASNFTKEKLSSATSIIIESDNDKWNADSTGGRYLVWVWYKTADSEEYRNLNIELLQNGLAIASNSANNRYGTYCVAAINQAKRESLVVHSDEKDPDFPYGEALPVTLKELRCNIADYDNKKVSFEGVVIKDDSGLIYIEEYDPENDIYCGITVFYQTAGLPGKGLEILSVGNRVKIIGTVTQFQGNYQVSGLTYSMMNPNHPDNINLISEGHLPAYVPTSPETFANGKVSVAFDEGTKDYNYVNLAVNTSIDMRNLTVISSYTTDSGDTKGAITLTCLSENGIEIAVRTTVLRDSRGEIITADLFDGATIDVKGLIDYYNYDNANQYQIKVFSLDDIFIHP